MIRDEIGEELGRLLSFRHGEECLPAPRGVTAIPPWNETLKAGANAESNAPLPSFVGIDGSYSFMFQTGGSWLGIVRVGALVFEAGSGQEDAPGRAKLGQPAAQYRLIREKIVEKPVIVSTNPDIIAQQGAVMRQITKIAQNADERHREIINLLRKRMEQELALETAAEMKTAVICVDGSLTDFEPGLSLLPQVAAKCKENGNILAGVSKDSFTHAFCKFRTDEEYLASCGAGGERPEGATAAYVRAPPEFEMENRRALFGDVYFSRLHHAAPKWFRVDLGAGKEDPAKAFSVLAEYSRSPLCPGYPYPMLEAHRCAVVVRQFRKFYEDIIIGAARERGIDTGQALRCLTHAEGRAAGAFHEYLDAVTRELR